MSTESKMSGPSLTITEFMEINYALSKAIKVIQRAAANPAQDFESQSIARQSSETLEHLVELSEKLGSRSFIDGRTKAETDAATLDSFAEECRIHGSH